MTDPAAVLAASFAALYAGHQIGDHIAQTDAQAAGKGASKGWLLPMAGHLAGYATCQAAALWALHLAGINLDGPWTVAGLALSVLTHGFIDRRWPVRWLLNHTGSRGSASMTTPLSGMYLADQSLHVGCLFAAALVIAGGAR